MKTFVKVWMGIGLIAIGVGITILVIAVASGASLRDVPTYSYQESYTDVKSIDMNIEYGEVRIIEGDEFSIDAVRLPRDGMESYVSDGTWIIRENCDDDNIFGMRLSVRNIFNWNDYFTPKITITLPKDFVADNITLAVSAGDVKADSIKAVEGDFNLSAGVMTINELMISEESKYTVGAGKMQLQQIEAKDITVDCGVGEVLIEGIITGDNDITCSVGSVELNLDGEEEEYSYDISSSIGNVTIDNNSYHNISNQVLNNNGAANSLSLNCGIGNISVDFN